MSPGIMNPSLTRPSTEGEDPGGHGLRHPESGHRIGDGNDITTGSRDLRR